VELVEGGNEGRHGRVRIDPEFGQSLGQGLVVAEFQDGLPREDHPSVHRRSQPSVGAESVESGQLTVGQRTEQIDDRRVWADGSDWGLKRLRRHSGHSIASKIAAAR
jgi:hypothetical protein